MNRTPYILRKLGTGVSIFLVVVSVGVSVAPRKAHAITDFANLVQNTISAVATNSLNVKEYILDPLAKIAAETVRQSLLRSIINWANSGFEGSPAFVTDLRRNLQGLSDYVADSFMAELSASGVINSPFRDRLVAQLRDSYRRMTSDQAFFETNRYTLGQYSNDPDAFLRGDFRQGGIRAWIHAWMNPQNNPLGAFGAARRELESRILSATSARRDELQRNNGFLDFCVPNRTQSTEGPLSLAPPASGTNLRPAVVGCRPGESVRTLGSLTHASVSRAVGSDIDMIVSADELDEVFAAVLNGLLRRTFDSGGFRGLSESPSGGGQPPVSGTTPAPQPGTLLDAIDAQTETLSGYRTAWERIRTAITRAQAACASGGDPGQLGEVSSAATRALAAITNAGNLLNELGAIRAKVSASGENALQDVREGTAEYQALLSSGRLPSVSELSFAAVQSQDSPDITPPTLYMRMNEIAANRCR